MTTQQDSILTTLESLVDSHGLPRLLSELSGIAYGKYMEYSRNGLLTEASQALADSKSLYRLSEQLLTP